MIRRAMMSVAWLSACAVGLTPLAAQSTSAPYDVYAVRYASIPFGISNLISGADRSRQLDIAMMVWVMKDPASSRVVLLDAGYYRDKFQQQYSNAKNYRTPADALKAGLGIAPDQVTDIIVSHIHWDHADGLDLFPKAHIWLQKAEYEHHVGPAGESLDRAMDSVDAKMLFDLHAAGRVTLIDGDDQQVFPGIRVYTGGKHTFESEYVGVQTTAGTVVLASDNAYLYENFDKHVPIAQTLDAASNLAAQDRMKTLATSGLIVPGHDPAVFDRFPLVKDDVVRIAPKGVAGGTVKPKVESYQTDDVAFVVTATNLTAGTLMVLPDGRCAARIDGKDVDRGGFGGSGGAQRVAPGSTWQEVIRLVVSPRSGRRPANPGLGSVAGNWSLPVQISPGPHRIAFACGGDWSDEINFTWPR
jgi:glyoxylase-like metal-dependent hydrolase (beta-lactamase superfamily II)